jgi:hypothetical protein
MFDGKCCMVTRTELIQCILHCWRSVGFEFKLWELATDSVFMVLRRSEGFSRHHLAVWFSSGAQYVGWSKTRCQLCSYDADCVYRAPSSSIINVWASIIDVWASMCFYNIICNNYMFLSGRILGDQHPLFRFVFASEDILYLELSLSSTSKPMMSQIIHTIFHNCIILVWHYFFPFL